MSDIECKYCGETFTTERKWHAHWHFEHVEDWIDENKEALSNE